MLDHNSPSVIVGEDNATNVLARIAEILEANFSFLATEVGRNPLSSVDDRALRSEVGVRVQPGTQVLALAEATAGDSGLFVNAWTLARCVFNGADREQDVPAETIRLKFSPWGDQSPGTAGLGSHYYDIHAGDRLWVEFAEGRLELHHKSTNGLCHRVARFSVDRQ